MRITVIAFVVALILAIPLAADCPTVLNPDDPPCVPNLYYTVFIDEPDWCSYSYGDWVFERWQNVGGVLTRTGWYVTPTGDPTAHPPSSFPDQYAEDAVIGCAIFPLPW